jgi:hypothetical protein
MNGWVRIALVGTLFALCESILPAQEPAAGPDVPAHGTIVNEPYSGVTETETVTILADGTRIDQKPLMDRKEYRDSQGRTREETYARTIPAKDPPERLTSVRIDDPIADVGYELIDRCQTAVEVPYSLPKLRPATNMQRPGPPLGAPSGVTIMQDNTDKRLHPTTVWEDLGTDTMEGLTVHGTRETTTFPTGFEGNDQPITVVTESWFSKELNIFILRKISDPRSGETTIRVTNIDQSEPDPALFRVPQDYTIVQQQPVPSAGVGVGGAISFGSCGGTVKQRPDKP